MGTFVGFKGCLVGGGFKDFQECAWDAAEAFPSVSGAVREFQMNSGTFEKASEGDYQAISRRFKEILGEFNDVSGSFGSLRLSF